MRCAADRLDLEMHEAAMRDGDLHVRRLRDDRGVRAQGGGDGLGADARELLVGDCGDDDVPAQAPAVRVGGRKHARREAALHVVRPTPVQTVALQSRAERIGHPDHADRVHVRVEHQRGAVPTPARDRHDVRPTRRGLRQRRVESRAFAPLRDEACDSASPEPPSPSSGLIDSIATS